MNERFSSFNVRFLYITSVIVYILISQNVKRRERERENLLDSGKKKGKILKIILKKKKSLLFAQFSMLGV